MSRSFLDLSSRSLLTTFAITAIVIGTFCPSHLGAQGAPQNPLDGDWVNVDLTRGIIEIIIDGKKVHPYGACQPIACDWGVIKAKSFASSVNSTEISTLVAKRYKHSVDVEITLSLLGDGRLRAETFYHFTDASGRRDYSTVYYYRRSVRPFAH